MSKEIENIDIKEFVDKGFLQEANRLFFHPMGLALSVTIDENGIYHLGDVWDYRADDEGIIYDLKNSKQERIEAFKRKAKIVQEEFDKHYHIRNVKGCIDGIEQIPE